MIGEGERFETRSAWVLLRKLRLPVLGRVKDVKDVDFICVNPIHSDMAVPATSPADPDVTQLGADAMTLPRGWLSPKASICRRRKSTWRAAWSWP